MGLHREIFKKWEEWEVRYIKKYYGIKQASSIARTLGRTPDAIQLKAAKLKLTKSKASPYLPEEREMIKQLYESGEATVREIAERLQKPVSAIRSRINKWGLKSPLRWKKNEWNFLKKNYLKMTIAEIAKRLGRTPRSVAHYANRHGLSKAKTQKTSNSKSQIYEDAVVKQSFKPLEIPSNE